MRARGNLQWKQSTLLQDASWEPRIIKRLVFSQFKGSTSSLAFEHYNFVRHKFLKVDYQPTSHRLNVEKITGNSTGTKKQTGTESHSFHIRNQKLTYCKHVIHAI
jgi:hypothetical protein